MDIFFNITIYCARVIWTSLPAIVANTAPILSQKIPFLVYPLDFNKTFMGERILGDHKTFRGLFFGVIASLLVITIQYLFYKITKINITLYNFDEVNFILLGFLMGFGVIFGDAVKSFFKRRLKIKPGQSFIPWDQIDCALGGLLFGRIVWKYSLIYAITIILLTFFLHIFIRYIAFYLGVCKTKW